MTIPIPDIALPYCRKANILEWRGFPDDTSRHCTHRNVEMEEFAPLATDGILCVVQFLSGRIDRLHLQNIVFPKRERSGGTKPSKKPTEPKLAKLPKSLSDLPPEKLTELLTLLNL